MSLRQITTTLEIIPPGDTGILVTAERIAEMIRAGSRDQKVKLTAGALVAAARLENRSVLDKVFQKARQYKYSEDHTEVANQFPHIDNPRKVEFLRSANFILTEGPRKTRLDCDDFSILIGSLLGALGYKIRLVIIATDNSRPRRFSHVYPEVFFNHKWIAMDALMKRAGERHPKWSRRTFVKV